MNAELDKLPYGTVVMHGRKLYWKSEGLDDDILTATDGCWTFVRDIDWKTFRVISMPPHVGTHTGHRLPARCKCEKCGVKTNWVVNVSGRLAYWCGCAN